MRLPPGLSKGKSPLFEADKYGLAGVETTDYESEEGSSLTILKKAHVSFAPEPNPGTRFKLIKNRFHRLEFYV